ncbi:MAG: type II toxin-antitoxin system RelE/ParE family toxin [Selenomonadaceae bacterium]|nr:type II toxin-antitoxin system RelE/ParE family toxin [Selenomonadaceae bacterium]
MYNNSRKLRYLPIFYEDLKNTVDYISQKLENPSAAIELINKVETAILNRLPIADSFEPYPSSIDRENTYYRIYVGNYVIYYVLLNEENNSIMEIRRFLYKGRNRTTLI